jgi:hypothetical protein
MYVGRTKDCGFKGHCTDQIMRSAWLSLAKDFRALHPGLGQPALGLMLSGDIAGFREYVWPNKEGIQPHLYKCAYQLETFLKRYRFANDMYTDKELINNQLEKQAENFERLAGTSLNSTGYTLPVLQRARKIISGILGEYDEEEHMDNCRFGKKANRGTSFANAYLDIKLSGNITGSREHHKWFKDRYLPTDPLLASIIEGRKSDVKTDDRPPAMIVVDWLAQTLVPKTWKALREITPDTHLGSFFSNGLGKVFELRLNDANLPIRRLQEWHKKRVKGASVDRKHATGDMSVASASILWDLLNWVLPRKWLSVVKLGRIPYIKRDGKGPLIWQPSFAGMGIGFTFTLQTLVFYGLVQAIKELLGVTKGRVSVYGDDLIYPSEIHSYVSAVFPGLRLKMNLDKTYVQSHFRESCGADFYHGIDVRPCNIEGSSQHLSDRSFRAFLYKLRSGLLNRWDASEIPTTLLLIDKALMCLGEIFVVPASFPDYSGIRSESPHVNMPWYYWVAKPRYVVAAQTWTFKHVGVHKVYRPVITQYPYLWDTLRNRCKSDTELPLDVLRKTMRKAQANKLLGVVEKLWHDADTIDRLTWREIKPKQRVKSKQHGLKLFKLRALVAEKGSTKFSVSETTKLSW